MPDPSVTDTSSPRNLDVQAFLYASGELDGTEAIRFENRLAEEQAAREALSEAVSLCQPLGNAAVAPDPGYRERVRRRLRPATPMQRDIGQAAVGSSRAVIWCLVGAAAVFLFLSLERSDENNKLQAQLHELAQELDRDIQATEQLKQELGQVEDELVKSRDQSANKTIRPDEGAPQRTNQPTK